MIYVKLTVPLIRRLVVTHSESDLIEYFKTDAGFQIVFGIGQ